MNNHKIEELIPQQDEGDYNKLLPAFLDIWNDSENIRFLTLTLQPFKEEITGSWFKNHMNYYCRYFIVQDNSDKILAISAVKINLEGFEIIGLGVKPNAKGKGIGSSLISHAITLASSLGYKAVDCSVVVDNIKMLRLLLQFEFTPIEIMYHARADGVDLMQMKRYL